MWKKRLVIYLFGVLLGVLLVKQLPISKKNQRDASSFAPSIDHVQLAAAQWKKPASSPSAQELSGRILLIFFPDSPCSSCARFNGEIEAWKKRFGQDLTVISVRSSQEQKAESFPLSSLIEDADQKLVKHFSVQQFPTFILLRPDGQRMATYERPVEPQKILEDLAYVRQLFWGKIKKSPLN